MRQWLKELILVTFGACLFASLVFVGVWYRNTYIVAPSKTIESLNNKIRSISNDNLVLHLKYTELKERNDFTESSWSDQYDEIEALKKKIIELEKEPNEANIILLQPPNPNEPNFCDIVQDSLKSTVHIQCPRWQGSGFVVNEHLICTAQHVTDGIEDYVITTNDGHKLHATRAISDKEHDVAFIYIDDLTCIKSNCEYKYPCGFNIVRGKHKVKLYPIKLGKIENCKVGQSVMIIGSSLGDTNFNTVSLGILSAKDRNYDRLGEEYHWSVAFQTSSPAYPGNSGGPVLTTDGVCRGILVGGWDACLNIVMPVDLFISKIDVIERMFEQDEYQREVKVDYYEDPYYNYDQGTEYYNE